MLNKNESQIKNFLKVIYKRKRLSYYTYIKVNKCGINP